MTDLTSSLGSGNKFLIFGCGFSGNFFAQKIRKLGCIALTSSRSEKNDPNSFIFNSDNNSVPDEKIFDGVTHILSCIPPDQNGNDPVLKILKNKFELPMGGGSAVGILLKAYELHNDPLILKTRITRLFCEFKGRTRNSSAT